MLHTKEVQFKHNGIDFKATITYSDKAFSESTKADEHAFYQVQLHTPIEMDCGGEVKTIGGVMRYMFYRKKKTYRFVYVEEGNTLCEGEVNVYPKAIRKILYCYYNREVITKYKKQVEDFEKLIDKKYALVLESAREKKRLLKKRLRFGEIDSKAYQKLRKPIRLEQEKIKHKMWYLKYQYKRRYFRCCELKRHYRIVKADKVTFCGERYSECNDESFYVQMKKEQ